MPVLVAGSTHPGEEEAALRALQSCEKEGHELALVLAPRHARRNRAVEAMLRATGRRTISELRGLGKAMPLAAVATGAGVLAIAGTPPLGIFDSEWMIFAGGFQTPYLWLAILAVLGSLLTVASDNCCLRRAMSRAPQISCSRLKSWIPPTVAR